MKKTYITPRIVEEETCSIPLLISASADGWEIYAGGVSEGGKEADSRSFDFFSDEEGEEF